MRYIIGIDLGTTNCALAFIDLTKSVLSIQTFAIPQLTANGKVDQFLTLPSFCYLINATEWPPGSLSLPWKEEKQTFVGQFAKTQGARVPTRVIQSAKSWLCNVAANRRDKILPVETDDFSQRLSPVEVSAKYLMHLKEAWNSSMAKGDPESELEEQEIILTVPASFDEVARSLTVEAARQAGFLHITLVEEPQAAFYSWISQHEQEWQNLFKKGDVILICDVGGGTTDFSLIEMQEQNGLLSFQRMSVGDHLLLGGDNIDITLAYYLEQKLNAEGHQPLNSIQWLQLQTEARQAKEICLSDQAESYTVILQGKGSTVIKGSLSITIKKKEIEELLLNSFFGNYSFSEALNLKRSRGLRTMGLPYEDEPSITKHLAYFLKQSGHLEQSKKIDYILFNGGTLKPLIFQQALIQSLNKWFPQTVVQELSPFNLDLAVARGAVYYGKVRRGLGVAIGGGIPRTYYLKIEVKDPEGNTKEKALTLLPRGSQEGQSFQSTMTFLLRPNTPVAFHLLTSHVRLNDKTEELMEIDSLEMQLLPPIQTILRFGRQQIQDEEQKLLPVHLGIRLTEIGTIELWLESQKSEHQWTLEFQLRSATGQDSMGLSSKIEKTDEKFEKGYLEKAIQLLDSLFQINSPIKPLQIMELLEAEIGKSRREWGPSILRELGDTLLKIASKRKISNEHEARWWNLAGFFLRPGFSYPLDDFRMKDLWKIALSDLKTLKSPECMIQAWICFRRLAGGLNKGQQMQLASEWVWTIVNKKTGRIEIKHKGELYHYSEKIRALAAMERLELSLKIRLGEALIDRIIHQNPASYDYWSLGRIGARHLLYGSIGCVIPQEICIKWIEQLLKKSASSDHQEYLIFLLKQLARKTDHRELNLPLSLIEKILLQYPDEELKRCLTEDSRLTVTEQEQIFGDQLPIGLIVETVS